MTSHSVISVITVIKSKMTFDVSRLWMAKTMKMPRQNSRPASNTAAEMSR